MRRVFVVMMIAMMSTAVFAQDKSSPRAQELVARYQQALKSDSRKAVIDAWNAINANPQAKEYMKKTSPKTYQSFELQGIAIQLENLQRKYAVAGTPGAGGAAEGAKAGVTQKGKKETNSDLDNNDTIQKALTNTQRVQKFPNQERTANSVRVKNFANQDRMSNQDKIKNRLKSKQ